MDFRRWYFSCEGQQRALRNSEATTFCEQEPAVGFAIVFLCGYRNYVVQLSWKDSVLSGALCTSCFVPDFSGPRCGERNRISRLYACCLADFIHALAYHFLQLLQPLFRCFVVVAVLFLPGCIPGFTAGRGFNPAGGSPGGS
ncbi:hypothetical protein F511_28624 [Dorcoceras hygrometricum]|uniref:Uncharacterized protein n=1 Tax=Dorcoceras hygrometricum TaxID=472368 RepID=A0A2Z7BSX0_9LAMI|nr:hypothetical protein F511_28624 [Dorcoceras hygrometricum]